MKQGQTFAVSFLAARQHLVISTPFSVISKRLQLKKEKNIWKKKRTCTTLNKFFCFIFFLAAIFACSLLLLLLGNVNARKNSSTFFIFFFPDYLRSYIAGWANDVLFFFTCHASPQRRHRQVVDHSKKSNKINKILREERERAKQGPVIICQADGKSGTPSTALSRKKIKFIYFLSPPSSLYHPPTDPQPAPRSSIPFKT